jgi:hypothetical protein
VYCSNGIKDKDNGKCNDGSEKPPINRQAFPNTLSNWYWSGAPYAGSSDGAWGVDFDYGFSSFIPYRFGGRSNDYAVRPATCRCRNYPEGVK